jgi:hypothetical protein
MFKAKSVLMENFVGRLEQTPVKTNRFLWHIKYGSYQSDLRIAAHGLIRPENYAVFAHNNVFSFNITYPYFMDLWELDVQTIRSSRQFSAYSFWRIDTFLANVDWFTDPNMKEDSGIFGFDFKNYVCAIKDIPNYALKLFKFDRDRYVTKRLFVTSSNGVASVRPYKNDFDSLVPDVKMNEYIKWRNENVSPWSNAA